MVPSLDSRVADPLELHVNRVRPNVLEAPEVFETTGDFAIEIVNDGKPTHVHLNLDDDLSPSLSLEVGNHFIPREGVERLPVDVDASAAPSHGKLRVSVGYGSETAFVDIRIVEPDQDQSVTVDERLAKPPTREPQPEPLLARLDDIGLIAFLGIAVLALIVGAMIIGMVTTPAIGIILVVIAVLLMVTVYILLEG